MREKEPLAGNSDYSQSEDVSEALLKKHKALMSDLEASKNTIDDLKEYTAACRQQECLDFNLIWQSPEKLSF